MITPQLGDVDLSVKYRGFVIEPLCFGGKISPAGFWARREGSWAKDTRIGEQRSIERIKAEIDKI